MIILMIIAMTTFVVTTGPGDYVATNPQQQNVEAGSNRR